MSMRAFCLAAGALLAAAVTSAVAQDADMPSDMAAMKPGAGRETTYYMCSACHSIRLVTQQGMNRERWSTTLDWMTDKQGMPPLDPATESEILSYLSEQYGPDGPRGRSPRR